MSFDDAVKFYEELLEKTILELNEEKLAKFNRMLDMLDEVEDVQNVYHNVKLPEEDDE